MISLIQYILESISSTELIKDFEFKEVDKKKNEDIINNKDNKEKLGINNSESTDDLYLFRISKHYQMIYKNKCLGIFGLFDFKDYKKKIESTYSGHMKDLYLFLINDIYKIIFEDRSQFEKQVIYVTYLLMLPEVQNELDIDKIATIKVFFNKLKDFVKQLKKDYIIANGKDEKLTKLYCKCGGFKCYKDFLSNKSLYSDKNHKFIIETSVIYELNSSNSNLRDVKNSLKKQEDEVKKLEKQKSELQNKYKQLTKELVDKLNKEYPYYYPIIKDMIKYGYFNPPETKIKYGISKKNILDIEFEGITKSELSKIVQSILLDGYEFKYNTDEEWKKDGYIDPLGED